MTIFSAPRFLRGWRAGGAAVGVWLALALPGAAQTSRTVGEQPAMGIIDPAEGARRIEAFRRARLDGDFCLRFQLTHFLPPRRGDTKAVYDGIAWGTWTEAGPRTRFQIRPAAADGRRPDAAVRDAHTYEWLVQNGPEPRIWVLPPGAAEAQAVPSAAWREPLFPGLVYTPFDLLMPFLYWAKFDYAGPARVKGRVTDLYLMRPPAGGGAAGSVRIVLDRTYNALLRAEQLDAQEQPVRRFEVFAFKQVQEQPLVKELDLLDVAGRAHDRFLVTAAALRLQIDPVFFEPARLATPVPVLPAEAWTEL